jgi:glycosyltransferase involved in cell wall biosynthesis
VNRAAEQPGVKLHDEEVLRGQTRRAKAGLYYTSYEEFREALALLESDPSLRARLGRNGRLYFDSHYTWDIVERKYLSLIARASQTARAPDAGPARSKADPASVS